MKKFVVHLILTLVLILPQWLIAQGSQEKPSINNLWTHPEEKKHRVIHCKDDSVTIYNSDPSKYWLQYTKSYKKELVIGDKPEMAGRIIYSKDSADQKFYRLIDYSRLGFDSVAIFEHPGEKSGIEECKSLPVVNAPDLINFYYSTEYLNYQKLARNAPELKKEDYLALLKGVLEELKKPEAAAIAKSMSGKTPDDRIFSYLTQRIRLAPYNRKIFPSNLQKASVKFKGDEGVKKIIAQLRPFFPASKALTDKKEPTKPGDKKDTKTAEKKTGEKAQSAKKK
jgi:hypothetical protein